MTCKMTDFPSSPNGNEDRIKCDICQKIFYNREELNQHNMKDHKRTIRCEICDKCFSSNECRKKHYSAAHRDENLKCDSCDIMYNEIKDLNLHKKFHTKEYPYLCLLCLQCFPNCIFLKEHLIQHEKEAIKLLSVHSKCDVNETSRSIEAIDDAVAGSLEVGSLKPGLNESPEAFICKYCGKIYRHRQSLHKHSCSHLEKGIFQCNLCDKKFQLKHKLIEHLSYHKRRKFTGKVAKSKVRPLCHVCGKSFSCSRELRKHCEFHLPTGRFVCKLCDKVYDLNVKLKKHMQYHRLQKREGYNKNSVTPGAYPCPICGKVFKYYTSFNAHRQIHKNLYNCLLCDKVFNKRWNLKTHMAIHLGKKPYSCSYCGVSYADRSNLTKHLLKHPSELGAKLVVDEILIGEREVGVPKTPTSVATL